MQTAYFHRAYWCYENNLGIAKIHYEPLGIFAILFEGGIPKVNVNFLDNQEFSYYWQQYKNKGVNLVLGVQIDRDVQLTKVIDQENVFKFSEINLEVKLENSTRHFRSLKATEWTEFQDDVFVEYQPCKSLIHVR
ncbi:hypothetical protein FNW02_37510 [Komarekiella sp. 'clone 1']|uniref:Uncharacterized protein n=1 Tax=Komarekiella delphini-convector SJRDD-AB1 TaxID=2593771 RepID=A0AA40VVV1_9NOST|nr:hypothetical protein [Komarekiella delphini-convector]MBD6621240.1 hypothetical protein [Komarekiella delphini-convector SJRDD-AB1]